MSKYTKPNVKVIDDRKSYNASYYAQNKQQLLNKASKKECCELCGRIVAHMNMRRHQKTPLCKRLYDKQQADYEAYFDAKEEDNNEQNNYYPPYIVESDDEEEIMINDNVWDLEEVKKKTEEHTEQQYKKLKEALTEFFKKMEDIDKRRKDKKITQEEYEILFKALVEKQAKFKY